MQTLIISLERCDSQEKQTSTVEKLKGLGFFVTGSVFNSMMDSPTIYLTGYADRLIKQVKEIDGFSIIEIANKPDAIVDSQAYKQLATASQRNEINELIAIAIKKLHAE